MDARGSPLSGAALCCPGCGFIKRSQSARGRQDKECPRGAVGLAPPRGRSSRAILATTQAAERVNSISRPPNCPLNRPPGVCRWRARRRWNKSRRQLARPDSPPTTLPRPANDMMKRTRRARRRATHFALSGRLITITRNSSDPHDAGCGGDPAGPSCRQTSSRRAPSRPAEFRSSPLELVRPSGQRLDLAPVGTGPATSGACCRWPEGGHRISVAIKFNRDQLNL